MEDSLANSILEILLKRIDALEREIVLLKAENECLKLELAAAKKNSRNSSKPPSSDIVKPPPSGGKGKCRIGAQPGHEPHFRRLFAQEQFDEAHFFNPPSMLCQQCGGELHATPAADQVRQQIDLRPKALIRREYRAPAYRCASCGAFHRAKLPKHVAKSGFVGDSLAAALVFLNAKGHASHSTLAAFMKDVLGESLSRGQIAKTLRHASAYHKYLKDNGGTAQFCLAHLVRELRFLKEHPDPETRRYATRSLSCMRRLFRLHHNLPPVEERELVNVGERLRQAIVRSPPKGKAENIANRFLKNGDSYLRFIINPGIEPTNNRTEQAIRHVVIDRSSSQGMRSPRGRGYKERVWTVLTTCAMRDASAFGFLRKALQAYAENNPTPSLMAL